LQCIFPIFHLIWIKFPTQDVHKTFLSNHTFCETQYSEVPPLSSSGENSLRDCKHTWATVWSVEVLHAAALYFHMLIMLTLWCCVEVPMPLFGGSGI
jgi:hypothetical protein